MASCPRSEAINLVNTFIYSNQKVRLHFVFTWKKQQYAIIDLLQCYVNFPAVCHNITQRDPGHLDILQNTLIYYIDDKHYKPASSESFLTVAIRESKIVIEPEPAARLFCCLFNSNFLHEYQIWSKTCFPCILPLAIKVLGEEAYCTYPISCYWRISYLPKCEQICFGQFSTDYLYMGWSGMIFQWEIVSLLLE